MISPDVQAAIDQVAACGPIRAWSVIVTVLGDLCRTREDRISAQALGALIGPLGISAQAVRVAIHRLRRDGWVQTERVGRASHYRLSSDGWDRTQAVRPRIYARTRPAPAARLVVGPPEMAPADFAKRLGPEMVILAPRTALVPITAPPIAGCLAAPLAALSDAPQAEGAVPPWAEALLVDPPIRSGYSALTEAVSAAMVETGDLFAATTLRLAILHHWRRLCLRHSPLADGLMPVGWSGDQARTAVVSALDRYPGPDPATLGAAAREAGQAGA